MPPWGWPELRATCRSIATGKIVSGEAVDAAVNAIREYSGVPYVVPFNRGRTAIEVGLRAMGISAGDDGQIRQWPTGALTKFVKAGDKIRKLIGLGC